MLQVCNSWGRGGPRSPGSPRPKSLMAFDKKLFGPLKFFLLSGSPGGRAGGAGPHVRGPAVPDPAHLTGIWRAGAEGAGAMAVSVFLRAPNDPDGIDSETFPALQGYIPQ